MAPLLETLYDLASQIAPEKSKSLANKIKALPGPPESEVASNWLKTPAATQLLDRLFKEWDSTLVSSSELASMLIGASYAYHQAKKEISAELVWTGPITPIVSTRRTEQALLEVINSANKKLFMTSFVVYKIPSIVEAIENAIGRGVVVSMLLESSDQHGGSISVDAIGKMKELLPQVKIYHWAMKGSEYSGAKVHAKVAVADGSKCFISSANLTGAAMEMNMEAGVVVEGGTVPGSLHKHLKALETTRVISEVSLAEAEH